MTIGIPPDERRCTATAKSTGKRCKRPATPGTAVCNKHGGNAPQVRAAGQRRLAERRAAAAAAVFGLPVDVSPHEALLGEVRRAAGLVDFYETHVKAVSPESLVWGRTESTERTIAADTVDGDDGPATSTMTSVKHKAAVNVWLRLYNEEREHLAKVSKAAIDAGVAERIVRLEESRGQLIARLITEVIDDPELGLDPAKREHARHTAAGKLRLLSSTA